MTDEVLTIEEIAALRELAEETGASMARDGELPAFGVGDQWSLERVHFEDWMAWQAEATRAREEEREK